MLQLTADRLLADVEPLPHALRLREIARTAHRLAEQGQLTALLDELATGGPYEQRIAALAALTGKQLPYLIGRLTDPDPVVRRYAHRAVRELPLPDQAVEQAVRTAPTAIRDELIRAVLKAGRTAAAERLVPVVRERWGAAEAGRLLPVCSPAFVTRELPGLAHAVTFTRSLGERHPAAVLDEAQRRLTELPRGERAGFWRQNAVGLGAAAARLPGRALDLLEQHPAAQYRPTFPAPLLDRFTVLAAHDPERTARVLVAAGHHRHDPVLRPALARRLAAAPLPLLTELAHRSPADHAALLRQLPPAARLVLHDAVVAVPKSYLRGYSAAELATMPAPERTARARARLAEDPEALGLLVHLPTAEALPLLLAQTRTAESWDRGHAWGQVVRQAGQSGGPSAVREALVLLQRLRNEQDPVRAEALAAVADLPPKLFEADTAELLARLTEDALTARDCSPYTRTQLALLACSVLAEHAGGTARDLAGWAVRTIERTAPAAPAFPRERQAAVAAELRPALERSTRLLLAFVDALHPSSRQLPSLTALLERVTADDQEYGRAVTHLLADTATRGQRVARLVETEPSATALPAVQAVLTRVRTDLLAPLLATGTSRPGRLAPVPLDLTAADRWTDRQVRAAAAAAARTVDDTTATPEQRTTALRAAAHLPGHGRELLLRCAGSTDVVLSEAALAALPWTTRPAEALPVLLGYAGGERARVAVYAAGRAARFTPADELGPALARIVTDPTAKVTCRKQAVRLAAAHLPLPEAAALLEAAYRAPEQHQDVRRVVVEQVVARPAELPLWDVLTEIAQGTSELRTVLAGELRPHALPADDRRRYAELVGRLALSEDSLVSAMGAGRLAVWGRYAPETVAAMVPVVTDLAERERWRPAARVVSAIAWSDAPHPFGGVAPGSLLEQTLSRLIEAVRTGGQAGDEDRDEAARQRIEQFSSGYFYSLDVTADGRARARAVAALLMAEPSLVPQAVPRLCYAIDLNSATLGDELIDLAAVLTDRPLLAGKVAEALRPDDDRTPPGEHLPAVVRRLTQDGGLATGLFAARLVALYGPGRQWPAQWRTALHALRRHPQADVRDRALNTWTAQE
ncbi:hypothetical protein [Kitasatospora sp. Root107]|uniref:hypothetical protein n=1 Tax=Kitasatospora sp. Root107 TaxID=1736424 RepID=UPI00070BB6FC|nr:hypothetical protein [Kitasatospora sp. Root107]KQV15821.1 hypothetical protein ASC99_29410 [Kitasatospora sp. Root107]